MSAPLHPADLRARILEAAGREPVRSRAYGARRRVVVLAFGFAATIAVLLLLGCPYVGRRPLAYVAALAGAWALVAGWATWAALARGRSMLGRPAGERVAIALLTPAALLACALVGSLAWPQTIDGRGGLRSSVICAAFTALFAMGPLVAFAFLRKNSDPVAPRHSGAALGAAAGAWGALGIELYCTRPTPWHVFSGHVAPVLALALVGALLGGSFLRVVAVRAKNE
jgi:hypothetical protein